MLHWVLFTQNADHCINTMVSALCEQRPMQHNRLNEISKIYLIQSCLGKSAGNKSNHRIFKIKGKNLITIVK